VKVKRLVCGGLAVIALGGCSGGVPAANDLAAHPAGAARDVSGVSGPTAAGNKAAAMRYASYLVSLARVPAGSKSLHKAPPNLADPASGRPSGTDHVDVASYYAIPMSFTDAEAWLKAFEPGGHLHKTGTSGGGGPGYEQSGIDFRGASNPAWQSADLGLIIETDSARQTYLRVDAVVVWLDPVPLSDTAKGPRIHFTVATGCPSTDIKQPDVTNTVAGLDRRLLPAQPPSGGLLCSYSSTGKLTGHRALEGAQARTVAEQIGKISLSHVDGASYSCPAAFGTDGYAAFDYKGGQTVDIRVDLSGCAFISNGEIMAMNGTTSGLFAHLGS
jgi:hypothetical protein